MIKILHINHHEDEVKVLKMNRLNNLSNPTEKRRHVYDWHFRVLTIHRFNYS